MKIFIKNFFGLCLLLSLFASCSSLIGNVKPIEEKSWDYKILDLSRENSKWVKLDHLDDPQLDEGLTKSEIPDTAYQSKKTGAIISLNSVCKTVGHFEKDSTLSKLSQQLLLGVTDITLKTTENKLVNHVPALETTVVGKLSNELMMIRTLVLIKKNCVYDFMLISRPNTFKESEEDFSRFISSFYLK